MRHPWLIPPLREPYGAALAEAAASLDLRDDLLAVVLAGSVVEGAGGPTSDLDLFVVIAGDVRQRRHLVTAPGVLVEMFLNPPHQVRRYFADERRTNGPSTASMLSRGQALLDLRPELLAALRAEATATLRQGPAPLQGPDRQRRVYIVRDQFEDAVDAVAAASTREPLLTLARCALEAVSLHYALRRRWEPKVKNVATDLACWDSRAASLLAEFETSPGLGTLRALLTHVLVEEGGTAIRSFDGPVDAVDPA